MARLSKRVVDSLMPLPQGEVWAWDESLPGFGVRVLPSGHKSWQVQYKRGGRTRRMSLGPCTVLTPAKARQKAQEILGEVAQGGDPSKARVAAKSAPTMQELASLYLERHAPKKKASSVRNDRYLLNSHILPVMGRLKVAEIDRRDIARLHSSMKDTPIAANRAVALLSKLFALAVQWGMRPDESNPARGVDKYREKARRRYLSGHELAALGHALTKAEASGKESPFVCAAVKLLLFTGCRKNEILTLKWSQVDLEAGILHLEDAKTGPRDVVLNQPAIEVLSGIPRVDLNPYVFAGTKPGSHWVNLAKPWKRLCESAALADCKIHDLRHSHGAIAASMGLGLPLVGALLGHHRAAATERYAHVQLDPLRAASAAVGEHIAAALTAPPRDKVIDLADKRGGE